MVRGVFLAGFLFCIGLLVAGGVIHFVGAEEIGLAFTEFSWKLLMPVAVFLALEILLSVWRWQVILRAQGERIPFLKLLPVWLAGNAFNYLSPIVFMGGEGVRTLMLKKRFGVSLHRGGASVVLDQLMNGVSVLIMIALGAVVLVWQTGLPAITQVILTILGVFVCVSFLIAFIFFQAFRGKRTVGPLARRFSLEATRIGSFLIRLEEEMMLFLSLGSRAVWSAFVLSALRQGTLVARSAIILVALGKGAALSGGTVALAGVYISYALPIPMALGVQEISQTLVFTIAGWGAGLGLAFSAIFRATELSMVFWGVVVMARSFTEFAATGVLRMLQFNTREDTRDV